jgi:hypothetical protein
MNVGTQGSSARFGTAEETWGSRLDWDNLDAGQLLPYRTLGDPLADSTIEAIFASGDLGAVRALMRHLKDNDEIDLERASVAHPALNPAVVSHIQSYLRESERSLRSLDSAKIEAGERFFAFHGPEVLMLLATYSLPASYTAKRGVQVLAQTGRLESDPLRRLIETTQMVVDVMSPGGLAISADGNAMGRGIKTAQKVRLMHAAIRHLILDHFGDQFVRDFGVPINQMDIAGTLMTFSSVVLDGLHKMGEAVDSDDEESYLYCWGAIGHIVGLRPELIPKTVQDAHRLTEVIRASELGRSPQGTELTRALVNVLEEQVYPRVFRGTVLALMHRFLGPYAKVINVPKPGWTRLLIAPVFAVCRWLDSLNGSFRLAARLQRKVSLAVIDVFLGVERGGNRPAFSVPDHLADSWGLHQGKD